jgi:chromosome segregation ATPase
MSVKNPQLLDEEIDKELQQQGIKEGANQELENTLNNLISILLNDAKYQDLKTEFDSISKHIKTVIGDENKIIRLYKDLRKKFYILNNECNKLTATLNEERIAIESTKKTKEKEIVREERKDPVKEVVIEKVNIRDDIIDEGEIEQLNKDKLTLKLQLEQSMNTNEKLEKEKALLIQAKDIVEREKRILSDEVQNLKDDLNTAKGKIDTQNKKEIEDKEKYHSLKNQSDDKTREIEKLTVLIEGMKKTHETQFIEISSNKKQIEKFQKEQFTSDKQIQNMRKDIEELKDINEKLRDQLKQSNLKVKTLEKDQEILSGKVNTEQLIVAEKQRTINKLNKNIISLEEEKVKFISDNKNFVAEIETWRNQVELIKNQKHKTELEKKKKESELLVKDKDIEVLEEEKKSAMDSDKSKDKILADTKQKLKKAEENVKALEIRREEVSKENSVLKGKNDHLQEELRLRENRIQELEKKNAEFDKKIKMQQDLYDSVRKDKNIYFKNLIEAQDDLVDKQNILSHNKLEIDRINGEIKKKESQIATLKLDVTVINERYKNKKDESEKYKKEVNILKQNLSTLEKDIERLKVIVEETEREHKKCKDEYKKTMLDRDNLCKAFF